MGMAKRLRRGAGARSVLCEPGKDDRTCAFFLQPDALLQTCRPSGSARSHPCKLEHVQALLRRGLRCRSRIHDPFVAAAPARPRRIGGLMGVHVCLARRTHCRQAWWVRTCAAREAARARAVHPPDHCGHRRIVIARLGRDRCIDPLAAARRDAREAGNRCARSARDRSGAGEPAHNTIDATAVSSRQCPLTRGPGLAAVLAARAQGAVGRPRRGFESGTPGDIHELSGTVVALLSEF
mmetsp:Transcript_1210/g.3177  ORF Transcript_1210/g.3177 Transcript_1210/m.3177 type:complete len:238 (+) Transcript_1210:126-839(+)